jgi:protein N-terminal amidase
VRIADKYKCYVTVGYPEKASPGGTSTPAPAITSADPLNSSNGAASSPFVPITSSIANNGHTDKTHNFNTIVTVSPSGEVLFNYRKSFLYYTDETWASEGENDPPGFFAGNHPLLGPVAMGICMDINPYKFLSKWDEYEFANHVLQSQAQLVIISMAWLTRLSPQELAELPLRPDNETLSYWLERFFPIHVNRARDAQVFIVFANRCGIEHGACYAGTSSVVCFREGKGFIFDILGKREEKCMVIDLQKVSPSLIAGAVDSNRL